MNLNSICITQIFKFASYIVKQDSDIPLACVPNFFKIENYCPEWISHDVWLNVINKLNSQCNCEEEIVQNAYEHLVIVEDLFAIFDDRMKTDVFESWIAMIWQNHSSNLWKTIIKDAWTTDIVMNPPQYFRPSLCLISSEWMSAHGYKNYNVIPKESFTFKKNEIVCFENNTWKLKTPEEIIRTTFEHMPINEPFPVPENLLCAIDYESDNDSNTTEV